MKISIGRIRTVKNKLKFNESLQDLRGKYDHCKILDSNLAKAIKIHCESVPHDLSHYRREITTINYFEDPSLSLKEMYLQFLDFY